MLDRYVKDEIVIEEYISSNREFYWLRAMLNRKLLLLTLTCSLTKTQLSSLCEIFKTAFSLVPSSRLMIRSNLSQMFFKVGVLKISLNSQKKNCTRVFLRPQTCFFIKKEAPAQVFSCEFCEIFNKNFFHRTPVVAASKVVESQIFQENIS